MIKNHIIICLGNAWSYDRTSKHQIMRILARSNDIVWVNYHGTRKPEMTGTDLRAALSTLRRVFRGVERVSPSIVQVTPLVVPGAKKPFVKKFHRHLLVAQIRRAVRSVPAWREKPVQVWSFAPDVPYLVGAFDEDRFVYYCVDEYGEFKDFDQPAIRSAERELLDRADVVITTSQCLYETKKNHRPDVALVRHGVDYDHFAAAWRETRPIPQDVAAIDGPIFGFFGLVHHWIDVELIAEVARLRPEYSFVMIGDCKADVSGASRLPNVRFLGRRPYDDLPDYCRAFAAGLLPFRINAMTRNVNPIKMYEYLAAGLPVVSTPLPEAMRWEGAVQIGATPADFAAACDAVLPYPDARRREELSTVVSHLSWEARVERLSEIIQRPAESSTHRVADEPKSSCEEGIAFSGSRDIETSHDSVKSIAD